jgi:hypothetical protein
MEDQLVNLEQAMILVQKTIEYINNEIKNKKLECESDEYEFETEDEFRNRFNLVSEWEKVKCDGMGVMEYSKLCIGDDCWYQGNTDRLGQCIIYRMIGTESLILCDMCMDNAENMDGYINKYYSDFKNNKKRRLKAEKLLSRILLGEFKVSWIDNSSNVSNDVIVDGNMHVSFDKWNDIVDVLPSIGYDVKEETVWHISKKTKK